MKIAYLESGENLDSLPGENFPIFGQYFVPTLTMTKVKLKYNLI